MENKLNFSNKKVIALSTLVSFCITTPFIFTGSNVNASIIRGLGGSVRSSTSSLSRTSIRKPSTVGMPRPTTSRLNTSTNRVTTNSQLAALNQRLNDLETQRNLELQKNNHPFNKAVMISGLISSGAIVAGVIGGIVQQSKFIQSANKQAETDQKVQEDLTNKRYHFQEVEVPEAEQYIIDYYKENFGIDITNK